MWLQLLICLCAMLALVGCSEKTTEHIGGPYYFETTKYQSIMSEHGEGTFDFQLLHKQDGKTTVISKVPIVPDIAFRWRIYGSNLAFIEGGSSSSRGRLVLFSEKTGNTLIDEDVNNPPWHITADDGGITCRYFDNGKPTDKPAPKFYSADYLKNL